MSIRTRKKKLEEKTTVVSKYFSPELQQIDESLSEFKTPKKKVVAPSTGNAVKSKKPAVKATKKKTVKSKGQKDIRAALKSQVNELESHSTDFQNVCTANGFDVDPEHLQLAIALSRSLHEFHGGSSQENTGISGESSAGSSQNLNDLSQTSCVRKALEKYGFIFPISNTTRTKIQDVSRKKPASRQRKMSSSLLKITPHERKEKVAEKVSKVLLTTSNNLLKATCNVHNVTIQYQNDSQCSKSITERNTLSYIDVLQNDREFYVNNIVEESKVKVGCLLRDWSAIPGREKSPEREMKHFNHPFQEYITNQLDLDTLLSGIFEKCVFNIEDCVSEYTKYSLMTKAGSSISGKSSDCHVQTDKVIEEMSFQNVSYLSDKTANGFIIPESQKEFSEVPKPRELQNYSPDIFDDDENYDSRHEISSPEPHYEKMPEVTLNNLCPTKNEFTPISYGKTVSYEVSQRQSNDYMDLTECIPTYIKDKSANKILCKDNISVDLTTVEKNEEKNCVVNNFMGMKQSENIDLTQSFGGSQTLLGNQEKTDVEKTEMKEFYGDKIQCKSKILFVDGKVVDNFDLTLSSGDPLLTSIENNIKDTKRQIEHLHIRQEVRSNTLFDPVNVSQELDLTQPSGDSVNLFTENPTIYDIETKESDHMHNSIDHEQLNNKSIDLTQNYSPEMQNNQESSCFEESHIMKIKETSLVYDPIDDSNNITDLTRRYNEKTEYEDIEQSNINNSLVCINKEMYNESLDITQSSNEEQFDTEKSSSGCNNESLPKNCEDIDVKKSFDNICDGFEGNSSTCDNLDKSNESLILSTRDKITSSKIDQSFKNNSKNSSLKNSSTDENDREDNESSFSSQNSNCNVFEISDEELDYSMQHYKDVTKKSTNIHNFDDDSNALKNKRCTEIIKSAQTSKICNFDIGGSSIFDGISIDSDRNFSNTHYNLVIKDLILNAKDGSHVFNNESKSHDNSHEVKETSLFLPDVKLRGIERVKNIEKRSEQMKNGNKKYLQKTKATFPREKDDIFTDFGTIKNFSTPKSNKFNVISNVTPGYNQYMVKMEPITPMMDYRNMSSPDRNSELEKYGIKPFKRKRAVQILEHIYYQTHPTIDGNEELADSVCRSLKRRRLSESAVNNSPELFNTSPVSSQKYHKNKDIIDLNLEKSSALNCYTKKIIAKRSFQKSISENNFGYRLPSQTCNEMLNDVVHGDFPADNNSLKYSGHKEINCEDSGTKMLSKFSLKKSKDNEISHIVAKSTRTKPKPTDLFDNTLEVQNDNLFDGIIFGNKPKVSTGKSSSIISPRKNITVRDDDGIENVNNLFKDSNSRNAIPENIGNNRILYPVTNLKPVLKEINCESIDWVFQKREKAKVIGCRVPLHIAFHNYVSARPKLWAAMLRYEPINIDAVHKGLLEDGYRYDAKDILRFMDKKCITVKTSDNDARNANYQKKTKQTLSQKSKK